MELSITMDDLIRLRKTVKEAYLIDAAIPNSHDLHSTITEKLQKYIGLKEELIRMWQLKTTCIIPLSSPNKLHESWKLLNLRPGLIQKARTLNNFRRVRKFLAEQRIKSAWPVRPRDPYSFKNQQNFCEIWKVYYYYYYYYYHYRFLYAGHLYLYSMSLWNTVLQLFCCYYSRCLYR